jgi:hypothetical protein
MHMPVKQQLELMDDYIKEQRREIKFLRASLQDAFKITGRYEKEIRRLKEGIKDIKTIGNRPDIREWRRKLLGDDYSE